MTDIEKLRKLLAKATPGPWENSDGHIGLYIEGRPEWSAIANVEHHPDQGASADEGNSNASLIVAAVNALPALLDEVERLMEATQHLISEAHNIAMMVNPTRRVCPLGSDDWIVGVREDDLRRLERAADLARAALKGKDND